MKNAEESWLEEAIRGFDFVSFKSRFKDAIRSLGITRWSVFCERANVSIDDANDAIEQCKTNPLPCIGVLRALSAPLGRDLKWMLTGASKNNEEISGVYHRSHKLVDDFAEMDQLPPEEASRLHGYLDSKLASLHTKTFEAAYRRGIPSSLTEVGWMYEEMLTMQG